MIIKVVAMEGDHLEEAMAVAEAVVVTMIIEVYQIKETITCAGSAIINMHGRSVEII